MSDITGEGSTSAEHVGSSKGLGGKSSRGHGKRFWWVYVLIILVVAVVVVVPCVILVAVPRMAQKKLDKATLSIDGIVVTNTQTNSIHMAINSTITTDGSTHATVDGFEGTMYLADVDPPLAFATIDFPETTADAIQTVNVSQEVPISDSNAFTTFNAHLIRSESVNVLVRGDTKVHVRGISRAYGVTFRKTVALTGMNGFKGISVTDPHVNANQNDNFNATTHIPNPSALTLEIGNTTFHTYFNGTDIGTSYIQNMVLRPGPNDFFIWADIDQAVVLQALTQHPWCDNGTLPVQLAGRSVTNHGQPLPYFADALAATNQSVEIAIGQAVEDDIGLPLTCSS
ncbi:hypothetical protein GGR53DRAFT_481670 [Hypoxylon sp. FL1150]|nr:hypothetical protein GGR53DRAFT_481670 [Hypoxylon sp. FL1150]